MRSAQRVRRLVRVRVHHLSDVNLPYQFARCDVARFMMYCTVMYCHDDEVRTRRSGSGRVLRNGGCMHRPRRHMSTCHPIRPIRFRPPAYTRLVYSIVLFFM